MAIAETLKNRTTPFEPIVAFEDPLRKARWSGFLKNKEVTQPLGLAETLAEMKFFLLPVMESFSRGERFPKNWNRDEKKRS